MKSRRINIINGEINQFYQDSISSLVGYIEKSTEAINAKKFFGRELKVNDRGIKEMMVEDSIGAYTTKLLSEGRINPSQEIELREILTARFAPKGTSGLGSLFKNFTYLDVMGSPLNAVTQIGDLAFPLYKSGLIRTGKSLFKAVTGKSTITKEDLGIENIAQEFSESSNLGNAVRTVFRLTGLTKIDSIGKETFINALLSKYKKSG